MKPQIHPGRPLPHWNERPPGTVIDTLIIHSMYALECTAHPLDPDDCTAALDRFQVSAHYLITQEGRILQLVPEEKRAWHAGVSKLPIAHATGTAKEGVNDFSIGVELLMSDDIPCSSNQYDSLTHLTLDLATRYPLHHILGHEHIALPPGRKQDPGPGFDWSHYQALLREHGMNLTGIVFP